jgi:hypothetical protein
MSFDINTNSFSDLLSLNEKVIAKIYWLPKDLEIVFKSKLKPTQKSILTHAFKNKLSILTGNKFEYYIKNYRYKGLIKSWHRFEDPLGIEDNTEIWIKKKNNTVNMIEKKPIGTNYITYEFQSKNKRNYLKKITHKSFIGLQSFLSTSEVVYKNFEGFYLPSKITMTTVQKVTTNETNTPKRTLVEQFDFTDYKLNKSSALEWFSKR